MLFAALLTACTMATSCQKTANPADNNVASDNSTTTVTEDPVQAAVKQYLTDSIGSQYSQGDVCIPVVAIIDTQQAKDSDNLQVLGDFWVYNYKIAGDTLKTVSGGDHPGMMTLEKGADGSYKVVGFDAVADGSDNLPSARRIFGNHYDAFHAVNSDQAKRDSLRLSTTADYVRSHQMAVKQLQDYGWPAVALP